MSLMKYCDELKKVFMSDQSDFISDSDKSDSSFCIFRTLAGYFIDLASFASAISETAEAEQIHGFRIVLRKIRTIIKGEPSVFSEEDANKFADILSPAALYSGDARDMGILMASLPNYYTVIPECFESGKKGFVLTLRNRTSSKRSALKKYIKSSAFEKAYGDICSLLIKYASAAQNNETDSMSIHDFAETRIMKRYSKVLGFIDNVENPNDEQIHQLRILCKKLRYTLEIFAPYADVKKTEKTISKLKELQNILGSYNDLTVQSNILRSFAGNLHGAELAVLASVMTAYEALKNRLVDDIMELYSSMQKNDKIFKVKKTHIRKFKKSKDKQEDNQ